jgi:hypothetical protein
MRVRPGIFSWVRLCCADFLIGSCGKGREKGLDADLLHADDSDVLIWLFARFYEVDGCRDPEVGALWTWSGDGWF